MKFLICGKWPIEIKEPEDPKKSFQIDAKPYQYEIFGRGLAFASAVAKATELCVQGLPQGLDVAEMFAGVGIQARIVNRLVKSRKHYVCEIDPFCLEHLSDIPGDGTIYYVYPGDSFKSIKDIKADLYILDPNSWTPSKFPLWDPIFKSIFGRKPVAVVLNDTTKPYFHMHKERYSGILEAEVKDKSSYTRALSDKFKKDYNYVIKRAVYRPFGTYYLLVPESAQLEEIEMKEYKGGLEPLTQ